MVVVVVAALRFLVTALSSPYWYNTRCAGRCSGTRCEADQEKIFWRGRGEERSGAVDTGSADAYLSVMQGVQG